MTDDLKGWREILTGLDAQVHYYESALKLGAKKKQAENAHHKGCLAAATVARDAVARKLAKMMEGE